ncbi:hypothetical protein [Rosenbergiella nectarea]|uniref:Uncharacterized protein n=1 Tax=Rosenbergiella nectarea TaxID=988801 RepID=A0A1H9HTS0_9GAMM|nr:hypothetical protein [Rosenbergiella nectarea]SEQ65706.1 hypothetical protein SAMN05216522_10563 [Rosenbergiella nectarea]
MPRIRLTVTRLYALNDERMVASKATAKIYVGDECIATEAISGLTETPVYKYIHHAFPVGRPIRVEWDTPGFADMTAVEENDCPCCQDSHII